MEDFEELPGKRDGSIIYFLGGYKHYLHSSSTEHQQYFYCAATTNCKALFVRIRVNGVTQVIHTIRSHFNHLPIPGEKECELLKMAIKDAVLKNPRVAPSQIYKSVVDNCG